MPQRPAQKMPVFMMLFISVFGFIGLVVMIALWSSSSDGFGSPPLFFKLFGSLIALAFVIMGFGVPLTALLNRSSAANTSNEEGLTPPSPPLRQPPSGYKCPHCGAGLDKQEVSPSGDVKCGYCNKWYNIHRPGM